VAVHIEGSVGLVTGANRGLGKAYVDALACSGGQENIRRSSTTRRVRPDARVIPLKLDITFVRRYRSREAKVWRRQHPH